MKMALHPAENQFPTFVPGLVTTRDDTGPVTRGTIEQFMYIFGNHYVI